MAWLCFSSFVGIDEGFNGGVLMFAPSLLGVVEEHCGSQPPSQGGGESSAPAGGIGGLPKSVVELRKGLANAIRGVDLAQERLMEQGVRY